MHLRQHAKRRAKHDRHSLPRSVILGTPPAITALSALTLAALGAEASVNLGVSGVVLGLSAYVMAEITDRRRRTPSEVLVIRGSRSLGSARRSRAVEDAIGNNASIRTRIETPPEDERDVARWRRATLHNALAREVAAVVMDNPGDDPDDASIELLKSIANAGTPVIIMGDFPPPRRPSEAELCRVEADPESGGLLAGEMLASALRDRPAALGVVVVRSHPAKRRPRAAYSALALNMADIANRVRSVVAEPSENINAVAVQVEQMCADFAGEIVILCTTDLQAVHLSRQLWTSVPNARDRLSLIGYDGLLDEVGEYSIQTALHHVIGTVDTKPYELGSLAGEEAVRRVRGAGGRALISLQPVGRWFDLSETTDTPSRRT